MKKVDLSIICVPELLVDKNDAQFSGELSFPNGTKIQVNKGSLITRDLEDRDIVELFKLSKGQVVVEEKEIPESSYQKSLEQVVADVFSKHRLDNIQELHKSGFLVATGTCRNLQLSDNAQKIIETIETNSGSISIKEIATRLGINLNEAIKECTLLAYLKFIEPDPVTLTSTETRDYKLGYGIISLGLACFTLNNANFQSLERTIFKASDQKTKSSFEIVGVKSAKVATDIAKLDRLNPALLVAVTDEEITTPDYVKQLSEKEAPKVLDKILIVNRPAINKIVNDFGNSAEPIKNRQPQKIVLSNQPNSLVRETPNLIIGTLDKKSQNYLQFSDVGKIKPNQDQIIVVGSNEMAVESTAKSIGALLNSAYFGEGIIKPISKNKLLIISLILGGTTFLYYFKAEDRNYRRLVIANCIGAASIVLINQVALNAGIWIGVLPLVLSQFSGTAIGTISKGKTQEGLYQNKKLKVPNNIGFQHLMMLGIQESFDNFEDATLFIVEIANYDMLQLSEKPQTIDKTLSSLIQRIRKIVTEDHYLGLINQNRIALYLMKTDQDTGNQIRQRLSIQLQTFCDQCQTATVKPVIRIGMATFHSEEFASYGELMTSALAETR